MREIILDFNQICIRKCAKRSITKCFYITQCKNPNNVVWTTLSWMDSIAIHCNRASSADHCSVKPLIHALPVLLINKCLVQHATINRPINKSFQTLRQEFVILQKRKRKVQGSVTGQTAIPRGSSAGAVWSRRTRTGGFPLGTSRWQHIKGAWITSAVGGHMPDGWMSSLSSHVCLACTRRGIHPCGNMPIRSDSLTRTALIR